MLIRHWTGLLSEGVAARFGALRYTSLLAILSGMSALLILGTAVLQEDEPDLSSSPLSVKLGEHKFGPLALPSMARLSLSQASVFDLFAPPRAQNAGIHGAEKLNVARFIARRYNVGFEQTQFYVENAYRTAREIRVDPWLILAVISVESSFNPRAQSSKGAQGLMQVLTRVHVEKFEPFGGVHAAFDPVVNIKVGSQILKEYIGRTGSIEGGLKQYVGAAQLPHDGGYGAKVLTARNRIAAAARPAGSGRVDPPRRAQAQGDRLGGQAGSRAI